VERKGDERRVPPIELVNDVRLGRATTFPTKHEAIIPFNCFSFWQRTVRILKKLRETEETEETVDYPNVHYLVEMIGKELYAPLTRPSINSIST
jgi:hypothetical protein